VSTYEKYVLTKIKALEISLRNLKGPFSHIDSGRITSEVNANAYSTMKNIKIKPLLPEYISIKNIWRHGSWFSP
jgi:hypothetical protein